MTRPYNFSSGPATLPEAVLKQAQAEMLDWHGTGLCVAEMSHRSKAFEQIAEEAEADFRTLLAIPDNYRVLFLQGGAYGQFAAIPLNLLGKHKHADYVVTGHWSQKAIDEARKYTSINIAASTEDSGYHCLPEPSAIKTTKDAAYVHLTANETIQGVEFQAYPELGERPLVADMSSCILSRPLDVTDFGVIYAGAQKNIGPAGLTLVIVRDDLLGLASAETPSVLNYALMAKNGSRLNTPPTYAWYLAGLVFKWLLAEGGLKEMTKRNERKAQKLYAEIDGSEFYHNPVVAEARSRMNVPFTLRNPELDQSFLADARAAGLLELKGHRSVGGMRASIYNAMPEAGVDALVDFMQDFAQRHG